MIEAPQDGKRHRRKPNRMSDAEVIVILIHFHSRGFRCFKHYYLHYICKHCKYLFPRTVSYNRFVEPEKEILLQFTAFIKQVLLGEYIGKTLFETLFIYGVQLFTKVKYNMKNSLMSIADKFILMYNFLFLFFMKFI